MTILPQAQVLALQQLLLLLYPAILTSGLLIIVGRHTGVNIPLWTNIFGSVFVVPFFHIVRARLLLWSWRRKAARLGAVLPPFWNGKKIANVDTLAEWMRGWREGYLSEVAWDLMDRFGPTFSLYYLWNSSYITADAEAIKAILATDFTSYVKGDEFHASMKSVLGTGVFNSDGDLWKYHRSMARPFFSRDRISHFELFDRHAAQAVNKIRERLQEGYAVNMADLLGRFTLDSATEFLFGASVHSLQSALPYPYHAPANLVDQPLTPAEEFARAFAQAQIAVSDRVKRGISWPWHELLGSKTASGMRIVDDFVKPILHEAVRKAKEEKDAGIWTKKKEVDDDETLLDHLARDITDPVVLHDEVLNIMIAGRDTTAATTAIVIYFLSQYPNVLQRLREEILDKVGPSRRPTYDDIREMKYLRAVLNETLRLYPSVPWNMRYAVKDTILPSSDSEKPWFVAAGTLVSWSVHCMHRRKDYWGPDAEEFDPDRFLDERLHKYLTPNPFIFLPFNAGPRICLGQQFAYNEMSFLVIRLLQNFETITLDLESQPPASRPPAEWKGSPGRKGIENFWAKTHLTVYPEGGVWVKMSEARVE